MRAHADDPVLVQDLSSDASATNVADDGTLGIVPVDNPSDPTAEDSDPFCTNYSADVTYTPTHPNLVYKTFFTGPPKSIAIPLEGDRYDPPYAAGRTFPVLILAHGGGWWRGCRWLDDDLAHTTANDGTGIGTKFITYSIDYRLACTPGDARVAGTPLEHLCGWTYQTADSNHSNQTQVAIHDVLDAIAWAKIHANDYCTGSHPICSNGKVYVAGGSAGGNLFLKAAAISSAANGNVPDAVAAWSGAPELTQMSSPNPVYGCTNTTQYMYETSDMVNCWWATNNYLGCSTTNPQPDPTCVAAGLYSQASPITDYEQATADSLPPVFFANGGGPVAGAAPNPPSQAGPELIALQESDDLNNQLLGNFWNPANYQECTVDTSLHGTAYLNIAKGCDSYNSSQTVMWSTLTFLLTH